MFRRMLAMLTMLCLLAAPALAQGYEWTEDLRDDSYPGFYIQIPQDPNLKMKLPDGWTEVGYSGSVAGFESADGRMRMSVSWIDEDLFEYLSRIEPLPEYRSWSFYMSNGDVECAVGIMDDGVTCVCPTQDQRATLIFNFELSDMNAQRIIAEHMICSLNYH